MLKKSITVIICLTLFLSLAMIKPVEAKKIYVIKAVNTEGAKEKFYYQKNGLLKKRTYGKGLSTYKYYYKNGKIDRVVAGKDQIFYYDYKNGRVSKITEVFKDGHKKIKRYEKRYYDKKGRLKKCVYLNEAYKDTVKYKYNRRNLIRKRSYLGDTSKYRYDKHRNIKRIKSSINPKHPSVFTLKYKKGLLVKSVATNMGDADILIKTYKYKKINVKKKDYKKIKKQNWEIINGDNY